MKKLFYSIAFASLFLSCKSGQTTNSSKAEVSVSIDLNTITEDKVMVTVMPTKPTEDVITFNIPKTVPGTYSSDNYGRFIEKVKAFNKKKYC